MKASIDITNELHRGIKAKTAGEGCKFHDVTIGLFRQWIDEIFLNSQDFDKGPVFYVFIAEYDSRVQRFESGQAPASTSDELDGKVADILAR